MALELCKYITLFFGGSYHMVKRKNIPHIKRRFMTIFRISIIFILAVICAPLSNAQVSIGYANLNVITNQHPEMAAANNQLNEYYRALQAKYETVNQYFQNKTQEYNHKKESGASQQELSALENELLKLQNELTQKAQDFEQKLIIKRSELTNPILDQILKQAARVAESKDIDCIFNITNNEGVSIVLYAPDNTELTPDILRGLNCELTEQQKKVPPFNIDPDEVAIGYTNVELILAYMPEAKSLEQVLKTYKKKLENDYRTKHEYFKLKYEEYLEKESRNELSPQAKNDMVAELTRLDAELKQFAQGAEAKLSDKRSELLEPILEKMENTINKVARENGFTFIMNQTTSSGISTILYGPEEADITTQVLSELNILAQEELIKARAQKNIDIAFMNVDMLLTESAQAKQINEELEKHKVSLQEQLKTMEQNLQKRHREYSEKVASGQTADGKVLKTKIRDEENQLNQFKQEMPYAEIRKQNELMVPLQKTIQKAIDTVAQEKDKTYIFNVTSSNIVYMKPELDLTQAAQARIK